MNKYNLTHVKLYERTISKILFELSYIWLVAMTFAFG